MKRTICLLLTAILLLSLCACKKKEEVVNFYANPEAVTVETIQERTMPNDMLNYMGSFRVDIRNDDPFNAGANASTCSLRYAYVGDGYVEVNRLEDYDNGSFAHVYFTSDPSDPYLYYLDESGAQAMDMTQQELDSALTLSLFSLEYYSCEITQRATDGTSYIITVDCSDTEEVLLGSITMTIDPVSGYVTHAETLAYDAQGDTIGASSTTISYGNVIIDKAPKEQAPAREEVVTSDEDLAAMTQKTGTFNFAAKDLDGNLVTYQDFADAKLIMLNFWEPWCEGCLDEMPDLRVLYEDYKDQGLVILGVTCDTTALEDAKAVVEEYAIEYPILQCDDRLALYTTEYVPTTYFIDASGEMLTDEPYIGAQSYEDWAGIVSGFLADDTDAATEE